VESAGSVTVIILGLKAADNMQLPAHSIIQEIHCHFLQRCSGWQ
jgi:hypothetical protein